jgi:hypothetical protein
MWLTFDHSINRGNLLAKTNSPVKFEGKGPMSCWDIDQKPFLPRRPMWYWPLTLWTLNAMRSFLSRAMPLWGLKVNGPWVVELLIGNCQCDLNLWPLDPKINRVSSSCQYQCSYKVWGPTGHMLSSYWSETVFTYKVNVTLTFNLLTQNLFVCSFVRPYVCLSVCSVLMTHTIFSVIVDKYCETKYFSYVNCLQIWNVSFYNVYAWTFFLI